MTTEQVIEQVKRRFLQARRADNWTLQLAIFDAMAMYILACADPDDVEGPRTESAGEAFDRLIATLDTPIAVTE